MTALPMAAIALEIVKSDLDAEAFAAGVRALVEETIRGNPKYAAADIEASGALLDNFGYAVEKWQRRQARAQRPAHQDWRRSEATGDRAGSIGRCARRSRSEPECRSGTDPSRQCRGTIAKLAVPPSVPRAAV